MNWGILSMKMCGAEKISNFISGDERYCAAAEECMRNCLCLFSDDGRGSAAYMYTYRINDAYGKVYDEWANDQDFALYFVLETGILS